MFKDYVEKSMKVKTKIYCGEQFDKSALVVEVLGCIDELNSFLSLALRKSEGIDVKEVLKNIQRTLFVSGSDVASTSGNIPRIKEGHVIELENIINDIDEKLQPIRNFVIPSGTESSLLLNVCRTLSRKTERRLIALKNEQDINEQLLKFFNRLSDLFFILSRYENKLSDSKEELWIDR